jgi:hypothetical protein
VLEKMSWLAGESQIVNQLFCSGWNITTAERYGGAALFTNPFLKRLLIFIGPFGGNTKNPIVFLSNTMDPITPLAK